MISALLLLMYLVVLIRFWFTRRPIITGVSLKPRTEEVLKLNKVQYDLRSIHVPCVTGFVFKALIWLSYTCFGRYLMVPKLMGKNHFDRMSTLQIPEPPTYYPIPDMLVSLEDHSSGNQEILTECIESEVKKGPGVDDDEFHLPTVADYVHAYRSGEITPLEVAVAVVDAIADSDKANPPLRGVVQSNREVVLVMASASNQ